MSKGISGLFSDTKGSRVAASSSNFMFPDEEFTRYIQNRKDVDANGFYDVVAHGMPDNILVVHNGKSIEVSHRVLSGLLEHDDRYGGVAPSGFCLAARAAMRTFLFLWLLRHYPGTSSLLTPQLQGCPAQWVNFVAGG